MLEEPVSCMVEQTAYMKWKFKIHSFPSLNLSMQSTPNSLYICVPGCRAILPTRLDRTPAVFQLQPVADTTDTGQVQANDFSCVWNTPEPLSTCKAIQSFHINADTDVCCEHHFVRSAASLVFWVRKWISGCTNRRGFLMLLLAEEL